MSKGIFCPVCNSATVKLQESYRSKHHTYKNMWRYECIDCEMVFAGPTPSRLELQKYNDDYFHQAHGGKSRGKVSLAFFTGIAKLRHSYLLEHLFKREITPYSVLEIGPGDGFFAREFLKNLPLTKYFAIESDVSCHSSLSDLGVQLVNEIRLKDNELTFDLIVMSHVLEHIDSPLEFLADISRNLRKGGALFIEVPCRDYLYKLLDEPHLLFFDVKPLKYLLEKLRFEVIASTYHGNSIAQSRLITRGRELLIRMRNKLIAHGFYFFTSSKNHMIGLTKLEQAVLAPYKAHCEGKSPSTWLRMIAVKN